MATPGEIYRVLKQRLQLKRACLQPYRSYLFRHPLRSALYLPHFVLVDHEITNFTYEISNRQELIHFLATQMRVDESVPARYIQELDGDNDLMESLRKRLQARTDRNSEPKFGRRLGWYSIVRMTKPQWIVETGTHDGLGAVALARALQRNKEEGFNGHLLTFDLDLHSGWLLGEEWEQQVDRVLGDTNETLERAISGKAIDFFIHDSNHSYEHESFEFRTVFPHLSEKAVLISDNAHGTSAMSDFCHQHDLPFAFFREKPTRHFYPGGGIGLSLRAGVAKIVK